MANMHPALFSFGIDATDVDRFLGRVKEIGKVAGEQLADAVIDLAAAEVEQYTPAAIDKLIDEAAAEAKAALHAKLFPEKKS